MADIFQEVEEDLKRDRAKQIWEKYGIYIVSAAVFIVIAIGGWRGYEWYQRQQAEAAGARFLQASNLSRDGKTSEAEAIMADLAQNAPSGYRLLAQFSLAGEVGKRDAAAGAKAFDALAADGSVASDFRDMARLRSALLLLDTADYSEIAKRIEPLTGTDSPWRHIARELLGLSAWRIKDMSTASRWFQAAITDADAPLPLKDRVQRMIELIAADAPTS